MAEWCVVESCSEWSTNGSLASLNPDNQTRLSSNPHLIDKCSDVFSDPLDCSVSWESSAHHFQRRVRVVRVVWGGEPETPVLSDDGSAAWRCRDIAHCFRL